MIWYYDPCYAQSNDFCHDPTKPKMARLCLTITLSFLLPVLSGDFKTYSLNVTYFEYENEIVCLCEKIMFSMFYLFSLKLSFM